MAFLETVNQGNGTSTPSSAWAVGAENQSAGVSPMQLDSQTKLFTSNVGAMLESQGQVIVPKGNASSDNPVEIITSNANRAVVLISNMGSVTVFVGTGDVTTANGFPILAGQTIGLPIVSALYAVAAGGTSLVAYMELV